MADQESSASAVISAFSGLDLSTEIIVRTPYSDIAEYHGTRAAIEAEGMIPGGTNWPKGFDSLHWEDNEFRYWLRRERPEGAKGPRRQFLDVDWWILRVDPLQMKSIETRNIERKTKELAEAIYRQSPQGRAESDKRWALYWKAMDDAKYQAFKSLIPGLIRPKRSRRPKSTDQSQGAPA